MCNNYDHDYATWTCPHCNEDMCWSCAVTCTDDGTGDGPIKCPHCGHEDGYFGKDENEGITPS